MALSTDYSFVSALGKIAQDPFQELRQFQKIKPKYQEITRIDTGHIIFGISALIIGGAIARNAENGYVSIPFFSLAGLLFYKSKKAESRLSKETAAEQKDLNGRVQQYFDPLIEGLKAERDAKTTCIISTLNGKTFETEATIKETIVTLSKIYDGEADPTLLPYEIKNPRKIDAANYSSLKASAIALRALDIQSLDQTQISEEAIQKLMSLCMRATLFLEGNAYKQASDAYVAYKLTSDKTADLKRFTDRT